MEFDASRVYTSMNADKLKVGSKVVVADSVMDLKRKVSDDEYEVLTAILAEDSTYRFRVDTRTAYCLAYLVKEKSLEWQDVQIGDVLYQKSNPAVQYLVTAKDFDADADKHIYAAGAWISDAALVEQYKSK